VVSVHLTAVLKYKNFIILILCTKLQNIFLPGYLILNSSTDRILCTYHWKENTAHNRTQSCLNL